MSLLYKPKQEQTVSVNIKILKDKRIVLDFYSDCGKFGTNEVLTGYILTPEILLDILRNERNKYTDYEI